MLGSVKDILYKLNYIIDGKQRMQYIFVTIIVFIGSMFELLGVAALLPFVYAITESEKFPEKWYYKLISETFNTDDYLKILVILAVCIVIIFLLKNLYLSFSSYVQAWYSTSVQRDLSIKLNNTFLRSSYLFHLGINSSVLIRTVNQDVIGVFAVFFFVFKMAAEVITAISVGVFIITKDPLLAVSLVVILGTAMGIVVMGLKKIMKKNGKTGQKCEGLMLQYLTQAYTGIKEILVMNRQEFFADSYNETCELNARITKKSNFYNAIPMYIYETVCIGGLILIVAFRLMLAGSVEGFVTTLATVAVAAFRLFPSIGRCTTNLNAIIYNRPRLDSIFEMMKNLKENPEYQSSRLSEDERKAIDVKPLAFNKTLKIDGVDWQYPTGDHKVLESLDLTINKGTSVALIGPSGAGKTTLADVILGLLKPQKGHIYLDDADIYENLIGWSKVVGYVPQSVYLTDDTIRNNVAFGIFTDEIDDNKVWKALEEAQLADYIKTLPDGLDTMVGESGTRLSGGQRQRIAIARALYQDPEILVLDEATSALDNETETAVMEAIDSLQGKVTMIIVAHRLTTIRNCDQIYEIANGKAVLKAKEDVIK